MQLKMLRTILRLEQDIKQSDIVLSAETLRDWLVAHDLPSNDSSRGLADLAFRFGRYRLAYQIGELEDMSDATV